jgi:hypothetical protein
VIASQVRTSSGVRGVGEGVGNGAGETSGIRVGGGGGDNSSATRVMAGTGFSTPAPGLEISGKVCKGGTGSTGDTTGGAIGRIGIHKRRHNLSIDRDGSNLMPLFRHTERGE